MNLGITTLRVKEKGNQWPKWGKSSSSYVWMWELDHKECWVLKNWCFQTAVLEKTLESPLDCKEIKPFNPKGYQPWIFIGRTDAEAEAPILWPPDTKNPLTGKDPDAEKDWGQKEKGVTEDEMAGWHHQLKSLSKLLEVVKDREAWRAAVHEVAKNQTGLSDWTTATTNKENISPHSWAATSLSKTCRFQNECCWVSNEKLARWHGPAYLWWKQNKENNHRFL